MPATHKLIDSVIKNILSLYPPPSEPKNNRRPTHQTQPNQYLERRHFFHPIFWDSG
ncbi:hypothetical protein EMIT0P228_60237 [Pseudomonas brassicacearum]